MVPLDKIIADMCCEEDIKTDYFIAGTNQDLYKELCDKVRGYEQSK
jgi:hypothetical protein